MTHQAGLLQPNVRLICASKLLLLKVFSYGRTVGPAAFCLALRNSVKLFILEYVALIFANIKQFFCFPFCFCSNSVLGTSIFEATNVISFLFFLETAARSRILAWFTC